MIIVSQHKGSIYNFDNINCLIMREYSLSDITDKKDYRILCYDNTYRSSDTSGDILGTYKTEERAKEVLQEIMKSIQCWEDLKAGQPQGSPKFIYEMPKE